MPKQQEKPRTAALGKASANFNERLLSFNLMEQLNHLCRGVQRHRGFSLGLLGGNQSFIADFHRLQQQMNRRIELITAFANRAPILLSHTDIERLHYAWSTIRDNWQDDSVLENFEFHSYFVDQLLLLMARLAEKLRQPYARYIRYLVSASEKTPDPDDQSTYQQLLHFSCQQLPRFIEILGKIRALSVHTAATGFSEEAYDKKLNYLLQCVTQEKTAVFEQTNHLQTTLMEQLPTLLTIKTYEYKLDYLLEKVTREIVEQSVISLKEEEIFILATDIIDIYWRVVDDSLSLLHRWHKEDLENWLIEG